MGRHDVLQNVKVLQTLLTHNKRLVTTWGNRVNDNRCLPQGNVNCFGSSIPWSHSSVDFYPIFILKNSGCLCCIHEWQKRDCMGPVNQLTPGAMIFSLQQATPGSAHQLAFLSLFGYARQVANTPASCHSELCDLLAIVTSAHRARHPDSHSSLMSVRLCPPRLTFT